MRPRRGGDLLRPKGIARRRLSPLPRPPQLLVPAPRVAPLVPTGPNLRPHPCAIVCKSAGTPLFAGSLSLAISLALSLHLCAPVGGCVSDYPRARLVPARAPLPAPLSRSRLPPAAPVRGPPPAGSGRLDSGCSDRGENASGSAPSAEPHSSRAGPLLFAAFPAPPRPPGRREGGRAGAIEKASEEGERGTGALLERSSRAALPRLTELRPLPEPGASPPRSWHPRLDPESAVAPPPPSLHTHTLSPDARVQAWPH